MTEQGSVLETTVHIVQLESMRAARVHAFSEHPETDAWAKLTTWARRRGLFDDGDQHRIFGHTRPGAPRGHSQYGYVMMITVPDTLTADAWVKLTHLPGGYFAALDVYVDRPDELSTRWPELTGWFSHEGFRQYRNDCPTRQWLEEHFTGDLHRKRLLMPIAPR